MKKSLYVLGAFLMVTGFISMSLVSDSTARWNDNTSIYEILGAFGEELPQHARPQASAEQIERGYDLVYKGKTKGPDGKMSKSISKYYVCTSCHNQDREDPDLSKFDPEARLSYVAEKGMKFLQGSPFYGIANRETWYNDDYYLKYGDLVKPANKSLAEATQLCAKVCSSGRYLEDWELEAILAYYWSIQIKLGDLNLSAEEKKQLENAKTGDHAELVQLIKSKYEQKSPATFGEAPHDKSKGFDYTGNPQRGKLIYELSCQSCHSYEGVSGMALDNSKLTFQKFKRNIEKGGYYNIYDIVRHGTYADKGKPRYMPLYPKERMSDQQLEDLKAYILEKAS